MWKNLIAEISRIFHLRRFHNTISVHASHNENTQYSKIQLRFSIVPGGRSASSSSNGGASSSSGGWRCLVVWCSDGITRKKGVPSLTGCWSKWLAHTRMWHRWCSGCSSHSPSTVRISELDAIDRAISVRVLLAQRPVPYMIICREVKTKWISRICSVSRLMSHSLPCLSGLARMRNRLTVWDLILIAWIPCHENRAREKNCHRNVPHHVRYNVSKCSFSAAIPCLCK